MFKHISYGICKPKFSKNVFNKQKHRHELYIEDIIYNSILNPDVWLNDLEIKLKYDNVEETIGVNQELYNLDEIKIITQDKKTYLLSYSNNKISRV